MAEAGHSWRSRFAAWSVHLFTATSAVLAFAALLAVDGHRWSEAMLWLFAALVVDGVDGTMARAAHVKSVVPRIDGDALDLVVDYLTYVFVPSMFMLEARLFPMPLGLPLTALILLSSLYVFARRDMKTEDGYFRGFPALWNIVALYFFATGLDPGVAAAIAGLFILLTFAPVHVAHPFRTRDYGLALPLLCFAWAGSTLALLLPDIGEPARRVLFATSAISALIIAGFGLLRTLRGPGSRAAVPE